MLKPNPTEQLWQYHKQKLVSTQDSVRLRNQIVLQHRNLVRTIAHRVSYQCAEPYQDLEQMGTIGLVKAVERYDPTSGNAFSSFAVPYIRGSMLHFLRDHGTGVKIPRRWREANSEINRTERAWSKLHDRPPTEQEISDQTGMKIERIREVRGAIAHQKTISLEEITRETEDGDYSSKELSLTASPRTEDVEPDLNRLEQAWSKLRKNLSNLEKDDPCGNAESDRSLIDALYYQRRSKASVAKELQIDTATLKARIQQVLEQLAA